ncbi:MAG: bifunctional diguanylate cyclase/phosphodiesterase [Chloroflexota bacterium]
MLLGTGGLVVAGYLLGPAGGGWLVRASGLVLALLAMAASMRGLADSNLRAWRVIALGTSLIAAGMLLLHGPPETPSEMAASALGLVGYLIAAAGVVRLTREGDPDNDLSIVLDATIATGAIATIAWFLLVRPWFEAGGGGTFAGATLALGFVSVDVAMVYVVVPALWVQRVVTRSHVLLAATLLAASISHFGVFGVYTSVGYEPGQPTDIARLLAVPLVAAAALHPSARDIRRVRRRGQDARLVRFRMLAIATSLFITPLLLLRFAVREVQAGANIEPPPGLPPVEMDAAAAMIVLSVLVCGRLFLTLARLEQVVQGRDHLELELKRQALSDHLTGLPNRSAFSARLAHALARAEPGSAAILFCDLDDFKTVNDTLGHAAGDEVLRAVAARLREAIRGGDLAARLGGDEFAVLLTGLDDPAGADTIARRVQAAFEAPFRVADMALAVQVSIGVAVAGAGATAIGLMRDADIAMYLAKDRGKARTERFEPSMRAANDRRLILQGDLAGAVARGEFRLVYQPTMNLGAETIVGAEALLRWQHPDRGLLLPADFTPVAEQSGAIVPLGRWVLKTACRQMRAWLDGGASPGAHVSVNVAAAQLVDPRFEGDVRSSLATAGLPASNLMLEISEGVLADVDAAGPMLESLKRLGVRIAIDDFGTGYSAMSYLAGYPIDVLKIDRSFVALLTHDEHGRSLVRSILQVARNLRLVTIAEGIESDEQRRILIRLGCSFGQGHLLGRPTAPEEVGAMLTGAARGRATPQAMPAVAVSGP